MEDSLLAIIEVPKEDRVLCQFKGCNHPIYKRVHVVEINEQLLVIGSTCYSKHFKKYINNKLPTYTSSDGKTLTEEERKLLRKNTLKLVQRLKQDHLDQIDYEKKQKIKIEAELKNIKEIPIKQFISSNEPLHKIKSNSLTDKNTELNQNLQHKDTTDGLLMFSAIEKAKEHLRNIKGIDPELEVWDDWRNKLAMKYYKEMKKS